MSRCDLELIYNYSRSGFRRPSRAERWSTYFDPGIQAILPAAAMAFRAGHISPARKTFAVAFPKEAIFEGGASPGNSAALRTLAEQSRIAVVLPEVKELEWFRAPKPAPGAEVVADPGKDFIPAGQDFVASDTGELKRDWSAGIHTVDAAMTQYAAGWIGGKKIATRDVDFELENPKAAVAVTSLDGKPVARSGKLLITAVARVEAGPNGALPFLSEPISGKLKVRSAAEGLKLFPLGSNGARMPAAPASRSDGAYEVQFPVPGGTHWFLLAREDAR